MTTDLTKALKYLRDSLEALPSAGTIRGPVVIAAWFDGPVGGDQHVAGAGVGLTHAQEPSRTQQFFEDLRSRTDLPPPAYGTMVGLTHVEARLAFVRAVMDSTTEFMSAPPQATPASRYRSAVANTRSQTQGMARWHEIYAEGYQATGESGQARRIGTGFGVTFSDAVRFFRDYDRGADGFGELTWSDGQPQFWGCNLYSTIEQAEAKYG